MSDKYLVNDVGIVSYMAYPNTDSKEDLVLESIYKIALDPFFSLIEITHIMDNKLMEEIKKILEISNMRILFGAHPLIFGNKININSQDSNERLRSVNFLKKLIDEAYYMNAESFIFLSGPKPTDKDKILIELDRLLQSINEICSYNLNKAKELSIKPLNIILEVFDDKPFAKNRLIGPTELSVEVSKEVNRNYKEFGLLLDLSHIPILGEKYSESLVLASKFLKHIHIGNCILRNKDHPAFGDEHPRFCIKDGENFINDIAGFIKVLKEIGYLDKDKNAISFEVKPIKGEDPDLTIAGCKRALINALKILKI